MIPTTRASYCLNCNTERVMEHFLQDVWMCPVCRAKRSITIEPVIESVRGGVWNRFWSNVKTTPFCWPWMKPCNDKKGPRFGMNGRDIKVARVAYYLYFGVWPRGGAVRTCNNDFCVRPSHLRDIRQKDMMSVLSKWGRLKNITQKKKTRCKRGHLYKDNEIRYGKSRQCRKCFNMMRRKAHQLESNAQSQ